MLDLQRLETGYLGIARLQARNHAAGVIAKLAGLVEVRVIALGHKAAITGKQRQGFGQGPLQLIGQLQRRLHQNADGRTTNGGQVQPRQFGRDGMGSPNTCRQCRKVARRGAFGRDAGQRPFKVRHFRKLCPHILRQPF